MKHKIGLLPLIILAIILGVVAGNFFPEGLVRVFVTFNAIFGQFLGFMVPLIIVGLVTPAIANIGEGAGRMLIATVVLAYADTVIAGLIGYGTGTIFFPSMVESAQGFAPEKAVELATYFDIKIPPLLDVMSALVLSFVMGLGIIYTHAGNLQNIFNEFQDIVGKVIAKVIIPLLPIYIFGIFTNMTYTGQAYRILVVFAQIILVIVVLHIFILVYEFVVAGGLTHRNPFRLLWRMIPAYLTALGTSSSAATIPVTLRQTIRNGVGEHIAGFTIPLCATIHMPGSMMKITCCALTVCLINGMPHDFPLFLNFMLLLAVCMVAGPGVPGGAIMAALGPLASILGFNSDMQALMIALYIAMDSFGTACNVTGDGAIAIIIDRMFHRDRNIPVE
jgi:Na+/H+-dicarboxylate symporter